MRRTLIFCVGLFWAAAATSFAQSNADEYTRNTTTVPNLQERGWERSPSKDETISDNVMKEFYSNTEKDLVAYLWMKRNPDGSREEFMMKFGSEQRVGRAAIKVDGVWYVGKAPFADYIAYSHENDFINHYKELNDRQTLVRVTLETVQGLKELTVMMEDSP